MKASLLAALLCLSGTENPLDCGWRLELHHDELPLRVFCSLCMVGCWHRWMPLTGFPY